jgi:hypothetical protein
MLRFACYSLSARLLPWLKCACQLKSAKVPRAVWLCNAVTLALARMSWLELLDLFRLEGLAKTLLWPLHLLGHISSAIDKAAAAPSDKPHALWRAALLPGLRQALLALLLLHGVRYPRKKEVRPLWVFHHGTELCLGVRPVRGTSAEAAGGAGREQSAGRRETGVDQATGDTHVHAQHAQLRGSTALVYLVPS